MNEHHEYNPKATSDNAEDGPIPEQEPAEQHDVIYVDRGSVDMYVMDVISVLSKSNSVTLRSKGVSIPVAVAIANVVTHEMLVGRSRVRKILLDTESEPGIGSMVSTAEIQIDRHS